MAAAAPTPRALPGCPGYSSALIAAQDALRRGDSQVALRKLREARAMLTACGRGADSSTASGSAVAHLAGGAGPEILAQNG